MRTDDMNEHSHSSGSQRDANESEDNPHLYKRRWLSAALLPSLDFHWRDPLFPAWTWRDGRRHELPEMLQFLSQWLAHDRAIWPPRWHGAVRVLSVD